MIEHIILGIVIGLIIGIFISFSFAIFTVVRWRRFHRPLPIKESKATTTKETNKVKGLV